MGYLHTDEQDGRVRIRVWNNGTGISERAKQRIFQFFFTTKPAGQGTGLGLSLSCDIITKRHGGEFYIESKEGEWYELTVILPAVPAAKAQPVGSSPTVIRHTADLSGSAGANQQAQEDAI